VSIKATPPRPMAGPRKNAIIRSLHNNVSRFCREKTEEPVLISGS
jgi:hypothetical protein